MCGKLHSTGTIASIAGTFCYIKVNANQPIQTLNKYVRLPTMAKKSNKFNVTEGFSILKAQPCTSGSIKKKKKKNPSEASFRYECCGFSHPKKSCCKWIFNVGKRLTFSINNSNIVMFVTCVQSQRRAPIQCVCRTRGEWLHNSGSENAGGKKRELTAAFARGRSGGVRGWRKRERW